MNDKYLKIYRYPKATTFNQTVKVDKFEQKEHDIEAILSGSKEDAEHGMA